jgi:hypothetical protein
MDGDPQRRQNKMEEYQISQRCVELMLILEHNLVSFFPEFMLGGKAEQSAALQGYQFVHRKLRGSEGSHCENLP